MTRGRWLGFLLSLASLSAASSASAQVVALTSGFSPDPRTMSGVAGGPVEASLLGPQCRGNLPQTPQQRLFLQTPMGFLRVWVNSGSDTTLLVRAPNGQVFCADDTWGNNPGVDIQGAMAGQYEVFVGAYAQGMTPPYVIGFSESRSSTPTGLGLGTATVVQPGYNNGPVIVPQQQQQQQQGVVIGGPVVQVGPQYPNQGGGPGYPLQSGFMPDPRMFSGISGGPMSAANMNPQCRGYINSAPSHSLQLVSQFNFLRVWVRSSGDTTLLVRAPNGQIFCADDTWGTNPGVDLNGLPPGNYQVYVGSYSPNGRDPYQMGVSELASSTPSSGGYGSMPAPVVQPGYGYGNGYGRRGGGYGGGGGNGAISLTSGFVPDPQMRTGMSGGQLAAMSMNSSCRGYIDAQPDHVLYLNSPFNFLRIYVQSDSDTTMMVRGPNGEVWCADDTYGLNPGIDLQNASPGQYQVFVGSYSQQNTGPYSIGFTENPGLHP